MSHSTPAFAAAGKTMTYRDNIFTYFQPICNVGITPEIVGFEALSRKPDKDGKVKSIYEDLEAINQKGERHLLEMHCLEDACIFLEQLPQNGEEENDKTVSVNLHPNSLGRDDICEIIDNVTTRFPEEKGHIIFEIIEDEFPAETKEKILKNIQSLHRAGYPLHCDDIGDNPEVDIQRLKLLAPYISGVKFGKGFQKASSEEQQSLINMVPQGVTLVVEMIEDESQLESVRAIQEQRPDLEVLAQGWHDLLGRDTSPEIATQRVHHQDKILAARAIEKN